MSFMKDTKELKPGLVIFRRSDVQHDNFYCRVKLPNEDRYKFIALDTPNAGEASSKAFDQDAELRFKIKHDLPIFDRKFSQVAEEYVVLQKKRAEAGLLSTHKWKDRESIVKAQLNPYIGNSQITLIGQDKWDDYPMWRHGRGKGRREDGRVSDATIRTEMSTFRQIMVFAAGKSYIRESQVFKGKVPVAKASREEFSPEEYRALHTHARKWVKEAPHERSGWYRTVAYNFMLIMTNTGMRPPEAKNLLWRDISVQADRQGREFVRVSVRGKGKHRNLVAAGGVAAYFDRIRKISKATGDNDPVFTEFDGKSSKTLYGSLISDLLEETKLTFSSSGSRRSTYCFRHTFATFRLSEGVDVYMLAKQMGTSVKMIEDHYGHITPVKNADRILQGLPGWEHVTDAPRDRADGATSGNEQVSVKGTPGRREKASSSMRRRSGSVFRASVPAAAE